MSMAQLEDRLSRLISGLHMLINAIQWEEINSNKTPYAEGHLAGLKTASAFLVKEMAFTGSTAPSLPTTTV